LNSNVFKCTLGFVPRASARGVTVDPETGKVYKVELVAVSSIDSGSLIEGKLNVGDVINSVTIDGVTKEVTRVHHLLNHMITARVGSTIVLNVTRGSETFDVTVTATNECLKSVR
jgi:C-terminal processing protease CtpA/Prc